MNETALMNTAKVRWLKSQEIYQILKEPPQGLVVDKIPTRPKNGDIFILDSKTIKRKWKQDGWTYMPRKQGIGFREDNENLRIGGENAITCYYSYIINGLLEGEEKVIVMNRRIYKLFPDGQYFFVHYLKDNAGLSSNCQKEGQTSCLNNSNIISTSNPQHMQGSIQNENGNLGNQKPLFNSSQQNQLSEKGEFFDLEQGEKDLQDEKNKQEKSELFYNNRLNVQNNHLNSTTMSISGDFETSTKQHQYPINDQTLINQEDSSYFSNSSVFVPPSKVSSTNTQDTVERHQHNNTINKSLFCIQNGNYILQPNSLSPTLYSDLKIDHKMSKMDEENEQQNIQKAGYNGQSNLQTIKQNQDMIRQNQCNQNDGGVVSQNNNRLVEYFNGNGQDGELDLKIDTLIEGVSQIQNNQLNVNFSQQQPLQSLQNCDYSDLDDWQNMLGNSENQQYKGISHASQSKNYNVYGNINQQDQGSNSIIPINHNQEVGIFQPLEIEGNYEENHFYNQNYRPQDNFNQQNLYLQQNINYNSNINSNPSNEYPNMYYNQQKEGGQFQVDPSAHSYQYQRNERFNSNQQNQTNQKNGQFKQSDVQLNKMTQHLISQQQIGKDNLTKVNNSNLNNNNSNQNLSEIRPNNTPSYSKLQERILELEQRLHKLEFDKQSELSQTSQQAVSMTASQQSQLNNSLGHSTSMLNSPQPQEDQNYHNQFVNKNNNQHKNNNNQNMYTQHQQFYSTQLQRQQQQQQQQQQFNQTQLQNSEQTAKIFQQQQFTGYTNININNQNIQNTKLNSTQRNYLENILSQQNVPSDKQKAEEIFNNEPPKYGYQSQNQNEIQEEGQKQQVTNRDQKTQQNQNIQDINHIPPIKVTEYSPEWDYTKGGSKMVLCFLPALSNLTEYQKSKFQIGFGSERVPAYCIQPGVLKCFVPPHEKGLIKLQIYLENERIDDIEDKPSYFEFRNQEKKKKQQKTKKVISNQDDEFYRNEFKVRIIDKLNSIQDFISSSSNKQSQSSYSNHQQNQQDSKYNDNKSYSDQQKTELDVILISLRESLDNLDNQSFNTLLTKIMTIAESHLKKNQIKKWIDQIDDNGYGLIHYIVILGFDGSLSILNEYECSLNLQSRNKITPLQLAFALNQEKIVEILIKSGVLGENLNQQLQGGEIKGDIQQLSNLLNFGAIYQSRNILDMLIREVTLHDSINNSSLNDHISWNDQEEQEDNYLDIKDLCEPSNENDLIKNLNAISHQLQDLHRKNKRYRRRKNNVNNQEGEQYSLNTLDQDEGDDDDDDEEEFDDEDDDEDDDDDDDDDEDDDDDDDDEFNQNYRTQEQNKQQSHENLEKSSKKHKYLRNYSEVNKRFNDKQKDNTGFDEKDDQLYMSQNYQCRIKTIQKNVRGWLLRRQYLDIKYATRVLQNYIRQRIAKKHIKPECKNMIKNKLIDWLSIKH